MKFRYVLGYAALVGLVVGGLYAQPRVVRAGLLLSPTTSGGLTCSESTAFLARTSGLAAGYQTQYGNLICSMVTDGSFAKMDAFYVLGTQDSTTALINLVTHTPQYNLTANGSPNFLADNGFLGVSGSTTVYLDTGFIPSTVGTKWSSGSPGTGHMGLWSLTNSAPSGTEIPMGAQDAGFDDQSFMWLDDAGLIDLRINDNTSSGTVANTDTSGYYVVNRSGSAPLWAAYKAGTQIDTSSNAPDITTNENIYILAINNNGAAADGAPYRIFAAHFGGTLTPTNIANIWTYLQAFKTGIP